MKTAYVLLAEGFEEIEAITPIDTLRRAGVKVVTVGVTGKTVTGAHQIPVVADITPEEFVFEPEAALVVLPGGYPGTEHLLNSQWVLDILQQADEKEMVIAAICAAPLVLEKAGLLEGKRATAFPSVQPQLGTSITVTGQGVEQDGRIITGRSAGVALEFAHCLIEKLCGKAVAEDIIGKLYPNDFCVK